MRPRYFFKYGQQNEYNLEICDTMIFATSRTAQHSNENNRNHQSKFLEILKSKPSEMGLPHNWTDEPKPKGRCGVAILAG